MNKTLYTLLFLLWFGGVKAQDDLIHFEELRLKAESFYYSNPDSVLIYGDSIFNLASAANNNLYIGEGKRLKGVFHQLRAESTEAKALFVEAASHFEESGDSTRFSKILLSIALMDINLGNYAEALDQLFLSKAISESLGAEQYELRARAEIGRVFSIQGEHEKALPQFQFYYNKVKDSQNLQQLATALNYLSVEFMQLDNNDSSLFYLKENLEVQKKLRYPIGIATALQNMAAVYHKMGDIEKALKNFNESYESYSDANFSQGIGQVKLNTAIIYIGQRKFDVAVETLEEAVENSASINDFHALRAQYELLSAVYDSLGLKAASLNTFRKFHAVSDTLLNIDKQRTISNLFTKYETKEKEQQISLQQLALDSQQTRLQRNRVTIISLVIIALLLIAIVLLVRNRAKKQQDLLRKEAELKARQAEINTVINSQENERNRFARDLHDGFGQLISVLKLNLSQLNEVTNRDMEKRAEVFKNGESVINEMFTELRNICFDLMPQTLVKRGLNSALKELGVRINQTEKVSCEVLVFDNSERLPSLVEISLFRITQEWINNILKYAKATHITVQLTRDVGEITLTIEDNGTGFDPQNFYNGSGNGWKNIQTRLNQINGQFELDSRVGIKSTMITVNVQLDLIPTTTDLEMAEA